VLHEQVCNKVDITDMASQQKRLVQACAQPLVKGPPPGDVEPSTSAGALYVLEKSDIPSPKFEPSLPLPPSGSPRNPPPSLPPLPLPLLRGGNEPGEEKFFGCFDKDKAHGDVVDKPQESSWRATSLTAPSCELSSTSMP
jgi:hypothetical protein